MITKKFSPLEIVIPKSNYDFDEDLNKHHCDSLLLDFIKKCLIIN